MIKDREGVDYEPQFLSKRSLRNNNYTKKEVSLTEKLDIRDYYQQYAVKDFDNYISFDLKKQVNGIVDQKENFGDYMSKRNSNKEVFIQKNLEISMEDCNMAHYKALQMYNFPCKHLKLNQFF